MFNFSKLVFLVVKVQDGTNPAKNPVELRGTDEEFCKALAA